MKSSGRNSLLLIELALSAAFVGMPILLVTQSVWGAGAGLLGGLSGIFLSRVVRRRWERNDLETLQEGVRRLRNCLNVPENSQNVQQKPVLADLAGGVYKCATAMEKQLQFHEQDRQKVEQHRALLESVLSSMGEGVVVVSGQGNVLFANAVARSLFGAVGSQPEGRPLMEFARSPELQEIFEENLTSGGQLRKEISLKRRRVILEIVATRLPVSAKSGSVLVVHNVTELKQLEQSRRDFVSNVSHELKTPLTAIQAYADTLLEGGLEDTDNNRVFLSRIIEQADRLQELIQDMLRLAKIESQQEAFSIRQFAVGPVIRESVESREALAESRKIQLSIHEEDPVAEIVADDAGLRTIVDNLISNAINYTSEGGHVDVRWKVEGANVVIEVEDDGAGISSEHHEKIFERFYRVERARSRSGGGTGLGLAIVKHLTDVFHGKIELQSEVGKGSLFRVRFPAVLPRPVR